LGGLEKKRGKRGVATTGENKKMQWGGKNRIVGKTGKKKDAQTIPE